MQDRDGMARLRRHDRRLLPPPRFSLQQEDPSHSGLENADLARRTSCEHLTFLDGRRKYVCAAFASHDEEIPFLRSANYTEYGFLRAGKRMGDSLVSVLLDVFAREAESNSTWRRRDRILSGRGAFVVGCVTAVVKIAALLLSRSLLEGAWPVMQVLSICTVPFGALKQVVSQENLKLGQFQGM